MEGGALRCPTKNRGPPSPGSVHVSRATPVGLGLSASRRNGLFQSNCSRDHRPRLQCRRGTQACGLCAPAGLKPAGPQEPTLYLLAAQSGGLRNADQQKWRLDIDGLQLTFAAGRIPAGRTGKHACVPPNLWRVTKTPDNSRETPLNPSPSPF